MWSKAVVILTFLLKVNAFQDDGECGKTRYADSGDGVDLLNRIVGGIEARKFEFPYQARLIYADTGDQMCGGAVINADWVVTAAHCVDQNWGNSDFEHSVLVRLGDHDITDPPQGAKQRRPIVVVPHPSYDSYTLENDIALIKVHRSLPVDSDRLKVRHICPPTAGNSYAGEEVIVSGWGVLEYGSNVIPDILQYTRLVVEDNVSCAQELPFDIFGSNVCAGDNAGTLERDTCQGDSGGPLAAKGADGRFILVGLTSWGIDCASGFPGVYTRVSSFLDWIQDTIDNN